MGKRFDGIVLQGIALGQGYRAFGKALLIAFSAGQVSLLHTRPAFGSDDTPCSITVITALH